MDSDDTVEMDLSEIIANVPWAYPVNRDEEFM